MLQYVLFSNISVTMVTCEECEEDGDELSLLRLAWCSLALGCLDEPLLTAIKIASGESLMKQLSLSSSLELQICVCVCGI